MKLPSLLISASGWILAAIFAAVLISMPFVRSTSQNDNDITTRTPPAQSANYAQAAPTQQPTQEPGTQPWPTLSESATWKDVQQAVISACTAVTTAQFRDYCTCGYDYMTSRYVPEQLWQILDEPGNPIRRQLIRNSRGACKSEAPQAREVTIAQINRDPDKYSMTPVTFTCTVANSYLVKNDYHMSSDVFVCDDPNDNTAEIQGGSDNNDDASIREGDVIRVYGFTKPEPDGKIHFGSVDILMKTPNYIQGVFIDNLTTGQSDYTK